MTEKVALITGAGSGVGRAAALALAGAGFAIVLAGRRREPIEAVAGEVKASGARALVAPADISDPKSVADLFASATAAFGRLDLLFNNAGINTPAAPIEDIPFDQWQAVVATNLTGMFLCTQHAIRIFKAQNPQGGRIINNGSISAHVPRPFSVPYNATKHAVSGLTKSTALEGRTFNIACGQIDIGNAATEMSAKQAKGVLQANGSIAVEPRMDASHVAAAVVYMASLPLDVNVLSLTVMATQMPFVGRG